MRMSCTSSGPGACNCFEGTERRASSSANALDVDAHVFGAGVLNVCVVKEFVSKAGVTDDCLFALRYASQTAVKRQASS